MKSCESSFNIDHLYLYMLSLESYQTVVPQKLLKSGVTTLRKAFENGKFVNTLLNQLFAQSLTMPFFRKILQS